MKPVDRLRAARDRIADKKNWTQGTYARNKYGDETTPIDLDAVCWDAVGAFINAGCGPNEGDILSAASRELFGASIDSVNDTLGHDAVLKAYDAAIAKAEGR